MERRPVSGADGKKQAPSCSEPETRLHDWMINQCLEIINKIMKREGAKWYTHPVDPIKMGLDEYNEIVKKPMDLGTVKRNIKLGLYDNTPTEFAADVKLVFDNAMLFNPFYREYDQRKRGLIGDDEKKAVMKWMEEWLVVRMVNKMVVAIVTERNPDMVLDQDPLVLDLGLLDSQTLMDLNNCFRDLPAHKSTRASWFNPIWFASETVMLSHCEEIESHAEQNPRPKTPLLAAGDGGRDGIHPTEKNAIPGDDGGDGGAEEEDRIPITGDGESKRHQDPDRYYTIDISSCTRREREEHKKRLAWELGQVQSMIRWVEASSVGNQTRLPPKKKAKKAEDLRSELEKGSAAMMRKCLEIVNKLMKQRGANWFNAPVDVTGMGLYDYNQIIKIPMDLGTVKANLTKGLYHCPTEFAADVKLTFDNAILYNPAGHVVHQLAKQLMKKFERMYYPAYEVYRKRVGSDEARKKRAMTEEEKNGLMARLEGLEVDEMVEVIKMMRNRGVKMTTNGNEVELEFEELDNDTLWALDGFLNTRQKKKPTNNIVNINNTTNKNKNNDANNNHNNKMEVVEKNVEGVKRDKESSSSSSSGSSSSSSSSSDSDSGRSLVSDPVQQTMRPHV